MPCGARVCLACEVEAYEVFQQGMRAMRSLAPVAERASKAFRDAGRSMAAAAKSVEAAVKIWEAHHDA